MTSLLIGFIVVLLVPLFVATWRTSLLGLSLQGILLFAIAYRMDGADGSPASIITILDLLIVRGAVAPLLLYRVLHDRGAPERNDVLPPNMLAWAASIGLVLLAFRIASVLVPVEGDEQMLVGAVATAVLIGFLVLSTQVGVFSQIIGTLRIENAIALFELGDRAHHGDIGLRIAQLAVFVASIGLFRWYLATIAPPPLPASDDEDVPDLQEFTS
jgi:hydrogenase-4 membrane subunit HyfE